MYLNRAGASRDEGLRGAEDMFDRFTDEARRVVVFAQEEARMLGCRRVSSEHILAGLLLAGDLAAAQALQAQGITLDGVRRHLGEAAAGADQPPLFGYLAFEREAKKALDLSRREALQLGHHHIGPEHILLGLIRGGDSAAAQLLTESGAELAEVRDEVLRLLEAGRPGDPVTATESGALALEAERSLLPAMLRIVGSIDSRLAAVEQRVGTAGQPDLPSLAERVRVLSDEVERLRGLLRQHGIQPRDGAA
jgi:ATP-dependent Clp protease ATP-binding subunit ClpA